MLVDLLALAGYLAGSYTLPQESISNLTVVSGGGGACATDPRGTDTYATVAIRWSLSNFDATLFDLKLYQDGVLIQTLPGDATSASYDTGYVEGASQSQFWSNWVFRVDGVKKSDGTVVSSQTAPPFVQLYGSCPRL